LVRSTRGSRPTWRRVARIWFLHTSRFAADKSVLTVWINYTFRSTAGNSIRFRDQSRETGTDGVSIPVRSTRGSRTTRRRVARISNATFYLRSRIWNQAFRTLAGRFSFLGYTHGARTTGVGITGVGNLTTLLGSWIRNQTWGTFAFRFTFLGDTHRTWTTGVRITRIPGRFIAGDRALSRRRRRVGSYTSISTSIKTTESPVWTI